MEKLIRYWNLPVTTKENTINGLGLVWFDGSDGTKHPITQNKWEALAPNAEIVRHRGDCIACFNHDFSKILGRESNGTLSLDKTNQGVSYSVSLNDNDPEHQSIKAKIDRKDVYGSSATFTILSHKWDDDVLLYDAIELWEIGPVVTAAMTDSTAFSIGNNEYARLALETHKRLKKLLK